jgi:hypothetical protein
MLSFAPLNVGEFYHLLCHYCFLLKKVQVQIAKGAAVPQNAVRGTLDCLMKLPSFCLQVVFDIGLFDCLGSEGRINTKDPFHPSGIL